MREINFFQTINETKKSSHQKWLVMALIPTSLIALLLIAFGFIRMNASKITADTESKKAYLNSAEVVKAKAEYEETKNKLDIINKYNASLDSINGSLAALDTIKAALMDKLEAALPKDTVFKSIAISNGSIKVTGECSSRITAAELLHNMSGIDVLENVKISSITKQQGADKQTFNLDANLKGGIKK